MSVNITKTVIFTCDVNITKTVIFTCDVNITKTVIFTEVAIANALAYFFGGKWRCSYLQPIFFAPFFGGGK
jgi:hypothetical protein